MIVGLDWTSWYGYLLAAAGAIATFGAAAKVITSIWRHVARRMNPEPPRPPDIVLGYPGAHISLTPLHELQEGEHRRLVSVRPTYLIENKERERSIRDVETGARTRDRTREHVFEEFRAPLVGAGETVQFTAGQSLPREWLDGVHESVAQLAFLYWVRFTDADARRWEVEYDPETRRCASHVA